MLILQATAAVIAAMQGKFDQASEGWCARLASMGRLNRRLNLAVVAAELGWTAAAPATGAEVEPADEQIVFGRRGRCGGGT